MARLRLSAAVLAIALLGACGRSGDKEATAGGPGAGLGPDTTASASMAPPDASGGAANAPLPLTSQAFVDAVAGSDLYEMGAARLADSADHPGEVRAFAQMMLRDHAKSSAMLKTAVGSSDNAAKLDSQKMTTQQEADIASLRAAAPADFGALYKKQQIAAHERVLAQLQTYAQSGDSKALMAFAAKAVPMVEGHLAAARKLP